LREPIQIVDEETRRLEDLAASFAALGRPPAGPVSEVDLPELMQSLLRSDTAPPTTFAIHTNGDVPLVPGHYDELVRLFRNLIRNAGEAMQGMPERSLDVTIARERDAAGEFVRVDIADRGAGFEANVAEVLFEP